ncbi:Uma2 family endonuclease [Leptolyngbya sp. NK1-12]|uniref:Uma2 family endonuclease n=2 Tax=Leptolyngbya sp. NK1-12 TaxID=2547451 RepID=A0AA96WK01_9CYAN|nr:Uma2 family endonuclease [Leptolyngbya sp. NK1-12]
MMITTAKWTLEQYHQMIEAGILEGRSVELLNGEIIEMPPEREPHANGSTETRDYLIALLGDRAQVREGHPITIPSSNSEPEPDLAIVQRRVGGYRDHHPYPENVYWLIEFANASLRKDLEAKADAYAAAGIPEYWVVNLKARELVVMRDPIAGKYQSQITLTNGDINPLAFPDLSVSVQRLLN